MRPWENKNIVVCIGTGGVGKTTVSAALGMAAAKGGKRVLVLTVDPAQRLADALGIQKNGEDVVVAHYKSGSLSAALVDSKLIFTQFIEKFSSNPESAKKLINNRLFQQLMTHLSGTQEFTAMERLLNSVTLNKYDLIILDTPPTQHAIDFLNAPEKIFRLLQSPLPQWFSKSHSLGFWQKKIMQGSEKLFPLLEKVTGSHFLTELKDFFVSLGGLQETVVQHSLQVHGLLSSPQTSFILITALDQIKLFDAKELLQSLEKSGHRIEGIIVNRSTPLWSKTVQNSAQNLRPPFLDLVNYHRESETLFQNQILKWNLQVPIFSIPEETEPLDGLSGIEKISSNLDLN
ncbi:MAG: AAA family ATPase [Bdellovibrionales bacterium]|nr:AAA family ATPase [Bdellovibrionales bacterium]